MPRSPLPVSPRRLTRWVREEYGFFRPHRPVYAPAPPPQLPPHLQANSSALDYHLAFVKEAFAQENDRKAVLEGKAAQLLGQTGLVLSLVGILTPLLADSLRPLPWVLGAVGVLFVATLLLFTNAVYHASSLTKVWTWRYMQPRVENLFKEYDPAVGADQPIGCYQSELILDYYKSLKHNQVVNDQKANFLSFAANSFTSALLLMAGLVLLLSLGLAFKPASGPSEVRLVGSVLVRMTR